MKTVKLGEVAEVVSGATPQTGVADYWGGTHLWITPAELSRSSSPFISETERTLTEAGLRSCAARMLPPGSVLLSSRAPIGLTGITTVPMATNQGFKSLVPGPDLSAHYVFHWLRGHRAILESMGTGATFKELSKRAVESIKIPLPDLRYQEQVAEILDRADEQRSRRRAQLRGLNLFIHSVFQDFSRQAPGELVPASEAWLSLRNGQSPDRGGLHEEDVLTLSSVTQSRFNPRLIKRGTFREVPSGAKRVHLGDFLLARGNGNKNLVGVGVFSGRSGEGIVFPDTVIAAELDTSRVDPRFFEAAWCQPFVRRQILSVARTTNGTFKVNQKALGQVMIPIPPVSVQREFAAVVAKVDAQRARVERALALEDELFASLQYRAFRGEL